MPRPRDIDARDVIDARGVDYNGDSVVVIQRETPQRRLAQVQDRVEQQRRNGEAEQHKHAVQEEALGHGEDFVYIR